MTQLFFMCLYRILDPCLWAASKPGQPVYLSQEKYSVADEKFPSFRFSVVGSKKGKHLSAMTTQQSRVSLAKQWAEGVEILLSNSANDANARRIIRDLPKSTLHFGPEAMKGAFKRYLLEEDFRNEVLMLGQGTDSMSLLIPDFNFGFIVNVQLMQAVIKIFVGNDEWAIVASQREMSFAAVDTYKELYENRHTLTGDFVIEEITKFANAKKKKYFF
ncbi:hypothetical protein NPIL_499471 [Nephila pilipes]|uniref:Uncharacterized protein n=1 Tax=Nephila pilipes TaxID=299642 RepID=A0A8X6P156_NEPPI|nr:hypothetical protein NPIL_499471 [Nephila pilipes]